MPSPSGWRVILMIDDHLILPGPTCDECGQRGVWDYLPKYETRDLCLGCLDAVEPCWREKKLGIRVISTIDRRNCHG
jgi:hypothetical protein